ncbi:hypothetical protein [Tropicimonas sp. IMCC6043]|uniref:hypothetical protein n=1 Tax=Tropicimonas sp. IMCC6043 TaxID=2510645 RepID=UPI00101C2EFD|nr:hypothetical protein [Tropicimonas sp. IMCC6043]RYH06444.1 hypothetical protein EU800_23840 [Tropicimonas sp. IMCC6043]
MFKATIISTFFAATAFQLAAEPDNRYDLSMLPADVAARVVQLQSYGDRYKTAIDAIFAKWSKPGYSAREHELDMSILPTDVSAEVTELQKHGERFNSVIRAIFIEALKPSWTFKGRVHERTVIEISMTQG